MASTRTAARRAAIMEYRQAGAASSLPVVGLAACHDDGAAPTRDRERWARLGTSAGRPKQRSDENLHYEFASIFAAAWTGIELTEALPHASVQGFARLEDSDALR